MSDRTLLLGGAERKHTRVRGFAEWSPHRKTRALLVHVNAVLHEYANHLPLTIRQIFYRLVGAHGYEKTEQAYDRLIEYRRPKIDTATERKGAKAACEGHWYLEGGETARHRKWHGAAHLKGASN